jgi:hypothetical protein
MIRSFAACLLLVPQAAWAHGDHASGGGVLHVLTSPEHLGVLLLGGAALALLHERRARRHGRTAGRGRNDTA